MIFSIGLAKTAPLASDARQDVGVEAAKTRRTGPVMSAAESARTQSASEVGVSLGAVVVVRVEVGAEAEGEGARLRFLGLGSPLKVSDLTMVE